MSDIAYVDLLSEEQKLSLEDEKECFLDSWAEQFCTCFVSPPCSFCKRFGDEAFYTKLLCNARQGDVSKVDEYNYFMAYVQWLELEGERQ